MERVEVRFERLLVNLVVGVTFLFALLRFEGPTEGYWDTYITAPAAFMTGGQIDFVLKDGTKAWDTTLSGVLPQDLVDKDSFGIITKDQRIGAPIVAAPFFAGFGLLGMRLLFALTVALIIPCGLLACRSTWLLLDREPPFWPSLLAAGMMAWNPYTLSIGRLNANLLVVPLALLLLYSLLQPKSPLFLSGILFGSLASIRNEAICFVPAISLWFLIGFSPIERPLRERFRRLVTLGTWTVVTMAPVFFWKWYAFGHPLMHPSQYPHFQGFRPEFTHQLLGMQFQFNGLFNWPLHDTLVRTPHFGFPTYILFPLVTLRSLGALACALIVLGLLRLRDSVPSLGWFFVAWMVPVYLLFGPQENWEEVKMTFMLLAWPPLLPLLALGLDRLRPQVHRLRTVTLLILMTVALMGLGRGLGSIEVPEDPRWYVRFPKAAQSHPGVQAGLLPEQRNDWIYFQSFETEDEIKRERNKLRTIWPWPGSYLPVHLEPNQSRQAIQNEMGLRRFEVLEIWGYIYGSRK
jgi:hypothetical protein